MRIFTFLLAILFAGQIFSQKNSLWIDQREAAITAGKRDIVPAEYRVIKLDVNALLASLNSAPMEFNSSSSYAEIELPMPDGKMKTFLFVESPIMEEGLSSKYPLIKTFKGIGKDDKLSSVRFDFTYSGFHAMILSTDGIVFIDPYSRADQINYISYYKSSTIVDQSRIAPYDEILCTLEADPEVAAEIQNLVAQNNSEVNGSQLRTYRLACAATGEYTAFHGGTVSQGLSAIVTAMNRVNSVYEKDIALRMVLVSNNDQIVYTNSSTDPYTNNNGSTMLSQNQSNLDNVIGTANYDIGHVFSTGGGGIAGLGVVCRSGQKARGVTGLPSPTGDPFYIDYVAHEMGHQWGGNHTFNGSAGSCSGGNRNPSTAYEPGSGSTIQAYAGICGSQNIQNNSDAYFHGISLDEMIAYSTTGSGNGCAVITNTGNNPPVVTVPAGGFTIPISTPFSLTGSATDLNNDPLTYCWEEFDLGPAGAPNSPSGNAPIFRSFNPVTSPTRIFPRLSNILNNTQTIGEILPTYTRILTFRLTARDNNPASGGTGKSQLSFNVSSTAGPFVVTYPNTNVNLLGNSNHTVTWDVANTNLPPVNSQLVNILLSTDGGNTWQPLVSGTANDGSESVYFPNTPTTLGRLKVEAADNIFFDISNANFTVQDNPIPVELTSFAASADLGKVTLKWETATEQNNSGFKIEKKHNGKFTQIGFVAGSGTTTEKRIYTFIDESKSFGKLSYRLVQVDYDGTTEHVGSVEVDLELPSEFNLEQNHPNPFNPSTKIKFSLPQSADVKISIYNMIGQEIMQLANAQYSAGIHEVEFNGKDLSSGIYYYSLSAQGKNGNRFSSTKKMMLIK